jgi:Glu-tRNA(Gln) amidotransferase subunit E-like FAD-binding protein
MHDQHPTMSYVDLNRSGVALMEIVSKPDLRSSEEAKAYLTKLGRSCATSAPAMATWTKGNLRADVNVSVRRPGDPLGTRCEIKNVNSIRFVGQAIEYEARRQIGILEDGGTIDQETRLFDARQGRDPLDALEGRGARLPLFPRSRSAAAGVRPGLCRRDPRQPAGTAGRQEGAVCQRDGAVGL